MSSSGSVRGPRASHASSRHRNQGSSSGSASASMSAPAVESSVTRLLVAIKQLLEALNYWSKGQMTDVQVSDVYVQLGNDFNSAVAAFGAFRIDMSELLSVPQDLRVVLEEALAEEASPAILDVYLPQVRAIIHNLLHGLRSKQHIYRSTIADKQERRSRGESVSSSSGTRHGRQNSSGYRHDRQSQISSQHQSRGSTDARPRNELPPMDEGPERRGVRDSSGPAPVAPSSARSPPRRETVLSQAEMAQVASDLPPTPVVEHSDPILGPAAGPPQRTSYAPSEATERLSRLANIAAAAEEQLRSNTSPPTSRPSTPLQRSSRTSGGLVASRSFPNPRVSKEEDRPGLRKTSQTARPAPRTSTSPPHTPPPTSPPKLPPPRSDPAPAPDQPPLPSPPPAQAVPPYVKRYSLSDNPVPEVPRFHVDRASPGLSEENEGETEDRNPRDDERGKPFDSSGRSTPPPTTPPEETSLADSLATPGMERSLAELKRSEQLIRRASKRFSSYTLAKMVGGGPGDRSQSSNRKSMLAPSSLLTSGDLNAVAEDDETPMPSPAKPKRNASSKERDYGELTRKGGVDGMRKAYRAFEEAPLPPIPPVPPVPRELGPEESLSATNTGSERGTTRPSSPSVSSSTLTNGASNIEVADHPAELSPAATATPSPIAVFLQIGRQIKKVMIEVGDLSFASLRVLFVDKFSYNPGASDFPTIYIRDPSSGVQYELEDVDEVQDKCLLSLNIEPLDQIKQHIDSQMLALSQDIKELKSTVVSTRRQSVQFPPNVMQVTPIPTPERPSEERFQSIAKRLTRVITTRSEGRMPAPSNVPIPSPLVPQMTGGSFMTDERAARIVSDLKTQFDEVQNLRRDLGVMRQLYVDFINSTKDSLGTLRTQTETVRELASVQVGGARAYIDTGKTKLDTRSQDILTRVDELQDTVEALRDDVIKRHVSPRPTVMKTLKADIATSAAELESLNEYIATIKPMWKQTWEQELQNIVEEQQFLNHQEEFVKDLIEDHKALTEVYDRVEKVISLRGTKARPGPLFRPTAPEEGHEGLSTVMLEIRGAAVDPERRMKAIEANKKLRDKELASRSDEFQEELSGFVSGKKLKMTGGAEEAERLRQKRNDLALKAMFQTTMPLPAMPLPTSSSPST